MPGDDGQRPDAPEPKRGRGPTISERVAEDRDEDEVTYLADEERVRYVSLWQTKNSEDFRQPPYPDEPLRREPVYTTTPWGAWAETQCFRGVASAATDVARESTGDDDLTGGHGSSVPGEDRAAFVAIHTLLGRDMDLRHEPGITFDELVEATPRTVEVTYEFAGQVYETDVPVYARHKIRKLY